MKNFLLRWYGFPERGLYRKAISIWYSKTFKLVKLVTLMLMIFCVHLSATDADAQLVTLHEQNSELGQVLLKIRKQTGYNFLFNNQILAQARPVTVAFKKLPLEKALKTIFEEQPLTYSIIDRTIVIKDVSPQLLRYRSKPVQPLPQKLTLEDLARQPVPVRGTVIDEAGEPLIGVNIQVKGTTRGTTTDIEGAYSIDAGGQDTLVFSYVGYKRLQVPVNGRTTINVTMIRDVTELEQLVVIGYGSMKKSDLTGSVMSLNSDAFEAQPILKLEQALQGRAAGVQVNQTTGAPGEGFKIRVRGVNSISGSNEPLYVLDGFIVGDINSINVNDIESMEILKDASATAIYGSRGANGVILITTKRGSKGIPKVEVDVNYRTSNIVKKLPEMNAADFAEGVNFSEGPGHERFTQQEIDELRRNGGVDWQDVLFKTAATSDIQLSVNGGSDALDYYLSGNVLNQDGTILDQTYKKYNFRSNLNANLSDKLKVGANLFGSREKFNGVRADIFAAVTYDPTTPIYDKDGNYIYSSLKNVGNAGNNPLLIPENRIREEFDNRYIGNGYISYDLIQNLRLRISGGIDNLDQKRNSYDPILLNNMGDAGVYNQDISRFQNTNMLTYTWDSHNSQKLQIDAIHEQQLIKRAWTRAEASQFFSDLTTFKNLALGAIQKTTNGSSSESIQSFVGRLNYVLFDRYLLTATLRADGSSKFRRAERWGYFPSVSGAWRLSEEPFVQRIDIINSLKLRASYGITGSQAIQPLATRSRPLIGINHNYPFTGEVATIGIAPSTRIPNPDLTWEKTAQTNIGVDLSVLKSRINFSVDVYKKNTSDLLLDVTLPEYVGPNVITQNVGKVENKGLEFTLGLNLVDKKDFRISSNLNFSANRNKVIALVDNIPIEKGNDWYRNTFPVRPTRVEVGKPISTFRGYVFEGVYQLGEEDEAAIYGRVPGEAKYKDVNGDSLITTDDIVTIGDGNPDFTWGLNTTVTWKRFDLNFLVLGSHGNDIYNFTRGRMMALGSGTFHATHEDYKNRWTPDNPSNIPSGRNGTEYLSSQFLEDGSYVTFKNISLSHTFKGHGGINKIGLQHLKLFASAENLIMLTKYRGYDPETTASGNSDVDLGIDLNTYPLSRSFIFGITATF